MGGGAHRQSDFRALAWADKELGSVHFKEKPASLSPNYVGLCSLTSSWGHCWNLVFLVQ